VEAPAAAVEDIAAEVTCCSDMMEAAAIVDGGCGDNKNRSDVCAGFGRQGKKGGGRRRKRRESGDGDEGGVWVRACVYMLKKLQSGVRPRRTGRAAARAWRGPAPPCLPG
jgi:hypothetical protein